MASQETFSHRFHRISLRLFDRFTYLWNFISGFILSFLPYSYVAFEQHLPTEHTHPAVLITGTSSGIGFDMVQRFLVQGYTVIATVRKQADADRLTSLAPEGTAARLHVIFMDMCKMETIAAAPAQVQSILDEHNIPFAGLVNNAGFALIRPVELQDYATLMNALHTNLIGAIELTRYMLPLLRKYKGRVIMISSTAGFIVAPWYGSYSAAKAGLTAWSTALRREVMEQGVAVSIVEPGSIRTGMLDKMSGDALNVHDDLKDTADELVKNALVHYYSDGHGRFYSLADQAPGPVHVYDAVNHALSSAYPMRRYLVGWDARLFAFGTTFFSERVVDAIIGNIFARDPWWLKRQE